MFSKLFYNLISPAKRIVIIILPVLILLLAKTSLPVSAVTITGLVYIDYNMSGTTTSGPATKVGVSGVTVTAVCVTNRGADSALGTADDTQNTYASASTAADGTYTLNTSAPAPIIPSGGEASNNQTACRVEFTNLPSGFYPSRFGTGNGTTVQFVNDNATNVNLGINRPGEFCQDNPNLSTSCYVNGNQASGPNAADAVLVSFPYTAAGTDPYTQESLANQIGSTWGLAYRRYSNTLFAAAFIKRNSGLLPGTGGRPGAIYRITPGGGTDGTLFVDLNALFPGSAGADPHTDYNPNPPDFDSGAYDTVGRIGLGGLAISDDDATLFGVNLNDRRLYVLPLGLPPAGPTAPTAGQVTSYAIPSPVCNNGVGRPFAVTYRLGTVYVGGVCTGETSGTSADLSAYVYSFNPTAGTFSGSPVLQFPLNYLRGCADYSDTTVPLGWNYRNYPSGAPGVVSACDDGRGGSRARWLPWRNAVDQTYPGGLGRDLPADTSNGFITQPQPMLTKIQFVGRDMVVGLRDRFADQIGVNDPGPTGTAPGGVNNGVNLTEIAAGHILRACDTGTGTWLLESNGQSAGGCATSFMTTPYVPPPADTGGVGSGMGPGGGEFYWNQNFPLVHDVLSAGGLVQVPGFPALASTSIDPIVVFSGGVIQIHNGPTGANAGLRTRSYQIIPPPAVFFGKANGLGDLVALCNAAPIEIGNRLWRDTNRNGIQDPGEPPLAGVTVNLSDSSGNVIATAITDTNGRYFFSNGPGTNTLSTRYNLTQLTPNGTGLRVRADNPADYQSGGPLFGLNLTYANVGGNTSINSKASTVNSFPQITVNTGTMGAVEHIEDFGFTNSPTAIELSNLGAISNTDYTWVFLSLAAGIVAIGSIAVLGRRKR